jgi:hypothetical protein
MTTTLAKFVDMDNIPKKYGGNLDWKFGEMPNLEPAIANSLRWREQFEQDGHKTLPIGPIKLQYDEQGDLLATAIGTEDGKARQRVIAGLHPADGVARLALSPGRVESTTSSAIPAALQNGTPPKPAATPAPATAPLTNGTIMSSDADLNTGGTPSSHVADSSRTGTYLSYQDSTDASNASREGTSETRYMQQSGTHAEGTLAEGTPALKIDSQGEKQALMDPHTVGQAPKEHPLPIPEEPAPSMMDQAKDLAGQAVEQAKQLPSTVMNAVGMGEKKEEVVEKEAKKEDPAVDAMEGRNVEEFLRSQTMSKPEA